MWDSRLWHGSHKNTSKDERWSIIATFKVWWAKQNFNPLTNINDDIYCKLSKQQKLIAGYLSIPPKNEFDRIVLKQGYNELKKVYWIIKVYMSNRMKTKLGYIKSTPRPTQEYLNDFYQNLYFKEGVTVTYNNKYTKRETYLKKFKSKLLIDFISQNLSDSKKRN